MWVHHIVCEIEPWIEQRTLNVGLCIITVRLVSSFTSFDSTAALGTYKCKHIFFSVKSSLVELETSRSVILPPTMGALWIECLM